jgi:hypothetical protein
MVRVLPVLIAILVLTGPAGAQAGKRHGVAREAKTYPQATAREALTSVLDAIKAGRFDYLVAHLADPAFVDERVKRVYNGQFDEQVQDTRARLDPAAVKLLGRFLKDGKWTIDKEKAVVQLDDVKDRCVRLIKEDGNWYLEHRSDPPSR